MCVCVCVCVCVCHSHSVLYMDRHSVVQLVSEYPHSCNIAQQGNILKALYKPTTKLPTPLYTDSWVPVVSTSERFHCLDACDMGSDGAVCVHK